MANANNNNVLLALINFGGVKLYGRQCRYNSLAVMMCIVTARLFE